MTLELRCQACGEITTTTEECSECGVRIGASAPAVGGDAIAPVTALPQTPSAAPGKDSAPTAQGTANDRKCPECGEARPSATARYCDVCRYDFVLKQRFAALSVTSQAGATAEVPAVTAPSAPQAGPQDSHAAPHQDDATLVQPAMPPVSPVVAAEAPRQATPVSATAPSPTLGAYTKWDIVAQADPSLCGPGDEPPADLRERRYPVDFEEMLVGRRSDKDHIFPEIALTDRGISKRHARIERHSDGTLAIIDLGSTNGTTLNGNALDANVSYPLGHGDQIVIGVYTRLTVCNRLLAGSAVG